MKTVVTLRLGDTEIPARNINLSLSLNGCGLGFITAVTDRDCTGQLVRLDLGYNNTIYRFLTGFVERSAKAENGAQRLFIRELVGLLDRDWPCSLQHPTLRDVINTISATSAMRFTVPDAQYADRAIPHFQHHGSGYQLLANLGRAFDIPDFVWYQLPDGTVFVGSYADSRFSHAPVDIPLEFIQCGNAGNSLTVPLIPAIRPGVIVNGQHITKVDVTDDTMTLSWTPCDKQGNPTQKSPEQRQIEKVYPELAARLHLPRLARVMSHADTAELGDLADPFRPRYAVNVQLLDEQGKPALEVPEYRAVPLPLPMATAEGGLFQYPPPGTLVEIGFIEGRPDKPMIRQILPEGQSLPTMVPGEQLQQQRAGVSQRVTVDGSWQRETDQAIDETSSRRIVTCDEETRTTTTRSSLVTADDTTTVLGTKTLMAGCVLQIAENDYSLGTMANMFINVGQNQRIDIKQNQNVAISQNQTIEIAQNQTIYVGQSQSVTIGQSQTTQIGGALTEQITAVRKSVAAAQEIMGSTIYLGTAQVNILSLMIETLDVIQQLAIATAQHTHYQTPPPTNAAVISAVATQSDTLTQKYRPLIG